MCLIVFVVEKGKQILGFLVGGHKRGKPTYDEARVTYFAI